MLAAGVRAMRASLQRGNLPPLNRFSAHQDRVCPYDIAARLVAFVESAIAYDGSFRINPAGREKFVAQPLAGCGFV
jgi:hypothetical protein